MKINLIFIGRDFYIKSGTRMASLYLIGANGNLIRFSLGEIEDVAGEHQINIRPANEKEMLWAYEELERIRG